MKAIEKQKEIPSSLCDATRNRRPARKFRNPQGCSLIDDAKKSDYVLASTSHPDSNELASTSVQTSKAKNVMVAPEHGHCLELAESCNLQVPSIPQSLREAVVKVSDSLFNSLPAMHIDMQYGQPSMSSSMEVTGEGLSEPEGIGLLDTAKFCSGSRFNNAVIGSSTRTGCLLSERTKVCADVMRKKLFQPYWSDQAVNESLKAGEAFKANFRINAHNRLEGYCTINGVTTDILINGANAQNRAILFSDARVLALGPRFMSIYVYKLAMERRIYFDDIEGLVVEWYEATGVLLLSIVSGKLSKKRRNGKCRTIEDIALVVNPTKSGSFGVEEEIYEDILAGGRVKGESLDTDGLDFGTNCLQNKDETEPGVFPLTLRPLSSVPVSINVVEGDNMPPDISVRLYLSSYLI